MGVRAHDAFCPGVDLGELLRVKEPAMQCRAAIRILDQGAFFR